MSHFLKNISGWFGYSRRERRASFILLAIIFLILTFRLILPGKKSSLSITSPVVLLKEQPVMMTKSSEIKPIVFFDFDPNKASENDLIALGMNERQSRTLIRYREKGGRFKKAEDLNRIYGMDSALIVKLLPFIKIAEEPAGLHKVLKIDTSKAHRRIKNVPVKTDLNSCDSADLEKLPWIGPVLSARIIKYRDLLGGYWSVDQLAEVYGITDSTLILIAGRLNADSADVRKININRATYGDLIKHPYFERYDVQSILKFRALTGRIDSLPQLVESKILTPAKAARVKPYIRF